jgi:hypothetical protein
MNRILLGALAALLFVAAGVFWWQGRAATERGAPPPEAAFANASRTAELPSADGRGMRGAPPPEAEEVTREQRRFDRFDRNRDSFISRNEMMSSRTAAFRALDTDGNNLLSFEEWAVHTSRRFHAADKDGDQRLTRGEFAATRPKPKGKPDARPPCRCPSDRPAQSRQKAAPVSYEEEDGSGEFGEPDL